MSPQNKPDLQSLYPTPKTYDEKRHERAEIDALKESWKPKHPRLEALGIIMLLAALGYVWIVTMPPYMMSMPFPGVFIAVLLGLAWIYLVIAGVKRAISLIIEQ